MGVSDDSLPINVQVRDVIEVKLRASSSTAGLQRKRSKEKAEVKMW
jgi:hypothetical protein